MLITAVRVVIFYCSQSVNQKIFSFFIAATPVVAEAISRWGPCPPGAGRRLTARESNAVRNFGFIDHEIAYFDEFLNQKVEVKMVLLKKSGPPVSMPLATASRPL